MKVKLLQNIVTSIIGNILYRFLHLCNDVLLYIECNECSLECKKAGLSFFTCPILCHGKVAGLGDGGDVPDEAKILSCICSKCGEILKDLVKQCSKGYNELCQVFLAKAGCPH